MPRLSASDQLLWLDRLEQDHDNLRAALAWAIEHQPEVALQLAGALAEFWDMRCYHSEGRRWLDQILDLRFAILDLEAAHQSKIGYPNGVNPKSAIARALHGAGKLAHAQEDNLRAQELFAESLALARALGDPSRIALLLNDLGELALHQGDTEQAMTLCAEGLALARAADDHGVIARLLLGLGELAMAGRRSALRRVVLCREPGAAPGDRRPARHCLGAPWAGPVGAGGGSLATRGGSICGGAGAGARGRRPGKHSPGYSTIPDSWRWNSTIWRALRRGS